MEEWKRMEIYGEQWNYEISSHGRIRNMKTGRIMKQNDNGTGYLQVHLSNYGLKKFFYVHRLVALTFIPNDNPQEKTQVNHKDENKYNNRIDNLEWATPKQNANYGTRGKRIGNSKKLSYSLK